MPVNFFNFIYGSWRVSHFSDEKISYGLEKQEKWKHTRAYQRENRNKPVKMSRKTKSVYLQFELDFVGLRWRALYVHVNFHEKK